MKQRKLAFEIIDGRIHTRSLEVHIVDHCNLRCSECCSLSPLLPERYVKPEDMRKDLALATAVLAPDYIKLVGGEPLLHPDILECLRVAKPMAKILSVTTNAVLLERMSDEFWQLVDALTISIYPSLKLDKVMRHVYSKAEEFNVILNIKKQETFVKMTHWDAAADEHETQEIFSSCWLRERCHIVDRGRFYLCTRPPHFHTFYEGKKTFLQDGVELHNKPSLLNEIYQYLTRSKPLDSCARCTGGGGEEQPHTMMKKSEIIQRLELR
ncbi:MAG: radical SAM protein [Pseudomonadota bacterium]